jgi:hypothetical protein
MQTGKNSMRFRETERIATVNGAVSFSNSLSIPTNPGLVTSFPWLSGHANLFENYKVHKLVYRYKNLKGTSSDGNILLSYDYDTLDPPPVSAIAATQSTHYCDGAPWRIFSISVPTDGRKLFTRSGVLAGSDLKTYDMGQLHVSVEGCADTSAHGYLEVDYDIEFFNKQVNSATPVYAGLTSIASLSSDQSLGIGTSILQLTNVISSGIGTWSGGRVTLPPGTYQIGAQMLNDGLGSTSMYIYIDGTKLVPGPKIATAVGDVSSSMNFLYYRATTFVLDFRVDVITAATLSEADHTYAYVVKVS